MILPWLFCGIYGGDDKSNLDKNDQIQHSLLVLWLCIQAAAPLALKNNSHSSSNHYNCLVYHSNCAAKEYKKMEFNHFLKAAFINALIEPAVEKLLESDK